MGFTLPLSRVPKQPLVPLTATDERDFSSDASYVQLQSANEYIGNQTFDAIFDTGSSDLWIVSSACTGEDCLSINKYVPTSGLSLANASFNLTYLTGAVSGAIGYETVTFGPYMVVSQVFALANVVSNIGLSSTGVSGVLGLAFPVEASIPITIGRTLLDNLFSSLESASRFYSYALSADSFASSFSVGQIDPVYADRLSEISFSPVYASEGAKYDYWKLPLLSLSVNSVPVPFALSSSKITSSPSPIAVLDTGTTLILGPTHDIDNFWTVAGGAQKGADGSWKVRCDHAVTVGLVLGNDTTRKETILDPSDVSWMPAGHSADGWCLGGIQSNDGVFSGDWLFGDVFLRNTLVVHHAATDSSPPLIGLLGTMNATQALERFRTSRGNDTTTPPLVHAEVFFNSASLPGPGLIFTAAATFAFFVGACLAIIFRIRRERNRKWIKIRAIHKQ
ncbi:acid protease [Phellopilus nigrolimitatus]|nr:acid protease [Phellopilus nigrolimitatus]